MGSQEDIGTIASLLPYLVRSGGNPSSRLSLTGHDLSISDNAYPFSVMNDSGPAARLLEGSFVTDTGSVLKKVFLLLQKDRYIFRGDELWPVTNPDIDSIWQQAFAFHARECKDTSSMVVLSAQSKGNCGLNQLAPLFFCKKTEQFFHPPCPTCGLPLSLCKNDSLLESAGLQTYCGSLKRYLYCAPCSAGGAEAYFVNELDNDDPPAVRDRWSLVSEFGALSRSRDTVSFFPCILCAEHESCYGSSGAARSRIVPFSFYPFYLLIFESMSLNALEFLPLLSGATVGELESRLAALNETGRIGCLKGIHEEGLSGATLFNAGDEKYFPEVLYLKLSFLDSVLRLFLAQPDIIGHPDMRPTIDRVWIDFPAPDGLLPSFWNFRTRVIDMVTPPETAERLSTRPSSNLLFYLGLLWFHTLLGNKTQGNKDIFPALKEGLSNNEGISSKILSGELSQFYFAPENIFWDPATKNVGGNWYPLWEKALDLGFGLLRSATGHAPQWSVGIFFENFEELRSEVKNSLLTGTPAKSEEPPRDERHGGDDNVCDILEQIIGKWRAKAETVSAPDPGKEDIELTETVILAPPQGAPAPPAPHPEEFTETVVLSSTSLHTDPVAAPQQGGIDDAVPETVIISPEIQSDELAETVIMQAGNQPDPLERQPAPVEDDLAETVILAPQRKRERGKGWSEGNE